MVPNHFRVIEKPWTRIILILFLTIILRLIIFGDLKPTGTDPLAHLVLAREIASLGTVPMFHTLYLPGAPWVYPPLFHAVLAMFFEAGAPPLETTFSLGLAFDVLLAIPVFVIGTRFGNLQSGTLAAILFAIDTSHIYPLTWGGYPNLMASLFIAIGVLALTFNGWRSVILLTAATTAIGLAHYLSLAVWIAILALFMVLDLIQRNWARIFRTAFSVLLASIPLAGWYVPRITTYLSLLATGPGIEAFASAGLVKTAGTYLVTFGLGGFLIIILPLTLLRMPWRENQLIYAWALAPLLLSIPFIPYPNIVIRLIYFSAAPSLLAFSIVALSATHPSPNRDPLAGTINDISNRLTIISRIRRLWTRRRMLIILVLLVLSTSQATYLGVRAHSFYQTYTPDLVQLANWFSSNADPSKTIVADLVPGLFVAAVSPRPVIFVANETWFSLAQEREEISAARSILYGSPRTVGFSTLVCKYSVGYLIYAGSLPYWYVSGGNETTHVVGSYVIVELHTHC